MNILPNNYFPTLEDMGLRTPEEAKEKILKYKETHLLSQEDINHEIEENNDRIEYRKKIKNI